ncbi:NAD(P)/FAD-dependent oxidoreductase [Longimicrobium sp.]|uniref:NAD(P)/FAD-dependent oxidoreductase n=1 Tax=Longimicrobium sp. TaxID=2029185 RepID=UPI003B3B02FB
MVSDRYDVVVVGGSFAGLAAAMQLARARRRVLVVDSGRPRNRFAHASHGFLGQDGRAPADIFATGRAEVLAYPTTAYLADEVTHARAAGDGFELDLASGSTVAALRLVLATGVADDLPDVPGLRERWGVSVLHCPYCHGYEVADRRFGVLARSEMAVHQALLVTEWSPDVTLFTHGVMQPDGEQRAALAARGVRIEERPVAALIGEGLELSAVRLEDGTMIPIDALFTQVLTSMASPLAEQLGCEIEEGPFGPMIRTDPRKLTTFPGVFAAGDTTRVPPNATLAAAEGVMAGFGAHQSLAFPSI